MDHSMRLVQAHCAKYLEMFAQCLDDFPYTWQEDCQPQRTKLSRCAETNPEIVHIKKECQKEFESYEGCMESNQINPEKCTLLFETFTTCADQALKDIQGAHQTSNRHDRKESTKTSS